MRFILLNIFLFSFLFGTTQAYHEGGMRTGTKLYYKTEKFSFKLAPQLRFDNNYSSLDQGLFEFSVKKHLKNHFDLGIGYRHINKLTYYPYKRWHYDIAYKFKVDRTKLKLRVKYQREKQKPPYRDIFTTFEKENHLRYRIDVKYNIKNWKFDPEFGTELFVYSPFNQSRRNSDYRIYLGTQYKINKSQKISIQYIFEQDMNHWNPKIDHIINLNYIFTLRKHEK